MDEETFSDQDGGSRRKKKHLGIQDVLDSSWSKKKGSRWSYVCNLLGLISASLFLFVIIMFGRSFMTEWLYNVDDEVPDIHEPSTISHHKD